MCLDIYCIMITRYQCRFHAQLLSLFCLHAGFRERFYVFKWVGGCIAYTSFDLYMWCCFYQRIRYPTDHIAFFFSCLRKILQMQSAAVERQSIHHRHAQHHSVGHKVNHTFSQRQYVHLFDPILLRSLLSVSFLVRVCCAFRKIEKNCQSRRRVMAQTLPSCISWIGSQF